MASCLILHPSWRPPAQVLEMAQNAAENTSTLSPAASRSSAAEKAATPFPRAERVEEIKMLASTVG